MIIVIQGAEKSRRRDAPGFGSHTLAIVALAALVIVAAIRFWATR